MVLYVIVGCLRGVTIKLYFFRKIRNKRFFISLSFFRYFESLLLYLPIIKEKKYYENLSTYCPNGIGSFTADIISDGLESGSRTAYKKMKYNNNNLINL